MTSGSKRRVNALSRDPSDSGITDVLTHPAWALIPDAGPDDHLHRGIPDTGHGQDGRRPHVHSNDGRVVFLDGPDAPPDWTTPEGLTDPNLEAQVLRLPVARHDEEPEPAAPPARQGNGEPPALTDDELARFVETTRALPPAEQERVKDNLRGVLVEIDGSTPAPEPTPAQQAPNTTSGYGRSIADPVAQNALNAIHFGMADPRLQHEMIWQPILLRAVVQMATYHADDRPQGGPGPQLAPDDLLGDIGAAWEQIRRSRPPTTDPTR